MSDSPSIQRTASTGSANPITQDALDRTEANLQAIIIASVGGLREVIMNRLSEHERRINELNNSHEKAIEAKRLSDEAATKIQERAVTKADLQIWKDEVNRALTLQAGAANANAKTWALVMGIVVILVNIATRVIVP